MFLYKLSLFVVLLSAVDYSYCDRHHLLITDNGPVVVGAEIIFKAEVVTSAGFHLGQSFRFLWSDNATPPHSGSINSGGSAATWSVQYPKSLYHEGQYRMSVTAEDWYVFWEPVVSNSSTFTLTKSLNGDIGLKQNGKLRLNKYVSVNRTVLHEISLSHPDYEFIKENATSVLTYWFVDCVYVGTSTDYSLTYVYTKLGSVHVIEAMVIASYNLIPELPTAVVIPTTTPKNQTEVIPAHPVKRSISSEPADVVDYIEQLKLAYTNVNMKAQIQKLANETKYMPVVKPPSSCINDSVVPYDTNKTYGYFRKMLQVEDPVSDVVVTGNNWLQHGDIMMLEVSCKGMAPFKYCAMYWRGHYNATGEETCLDPINALSCQFSIMHYFPDPDVHTVLLVLSNQVDTNVSSVVINVYNVKKQPQLSVIVVPVTFSIVAVVLIIFGVAYYLQSRARYTIEVADFDFGEQYADLEYKTFIERIRDSVYNALRFGTADDSSEPQPSGSSATRRGWSSPNKNQYGTLT